MTEISTKNEARELYPPVRKKKTKTIKKDKLFYSQQYLVTSLQLGSAFLSSVFL